MSKDITLFIPSAGIWNLSNHLKGQKIESVKVIGFTIWQYAKAGSREIVQSKRGRINNVEDNIWHVLSSDKPAVILRNPVEEKSLFIKVVPKEKNKTANVYSLSNAEIVIPKDPTIAEDGTSYFTLTCSFDDSTYRFNLGKGQEGFIGILVKFSISNEED